MPANFTRRLDLFHDAGFSDPAGAVADLQGMLGGLSTAGDASALIAAVNTTRARHPLPEDLARLIALSPEWLFTRTGDLSTLLWLAARTHTGAFPMGAFVLGMLGAILDAGRRAEGFGLLRFLSDVDFHFGKLYQEKGPAYGFFREREPNPFVFKVLEYFERRRTRLRILDLGAGIGNDALGFLASPLVDEVLAADLSKEELAKAEERADEQAQKLGSKSRLRATAGDFVELLGQMTPSSSAPNLIYSYSSLHYFNSTELAAIFDRVHALLQPNHGHFAFAIKGAGSIWDGQGVPLYRPDVWINLDGQSRWFPSVTAIDSLVDRHGFALKLHELHEHWGYSETGKRDVFHYVLCEAL